VNLKTFSRKGGKASSERKTRANRAKAVAYWKAVRSGEAVPPRRYRKPPSAGEIGERLAPYCRQHGIVQLEIFGSVARNEAGPRSDVDLMATFRSNPGLAFFGMEEEMRELLGVPVHLLSRASVETMSNPHRRDSILADARPIFDVRAR
jgi:uncharacterized protein